MEVNAIRSEMNQAVHLEDVYGAAGHLMRRAQQIAAAIFFDEMRQFDLTPIQYAALVAIQDRPGIDQSTLVNLIAIDRSTVGNMLRRVEEKRLISRVTPKHNQRIKQLFITPEGRRILRKSGNAMARVHDRILAPLSPRERSTLMATLTKLVHLNNEESRAPLRLVTIDPPARRGRK
jgi:MarR family transcriptional regulator, lower aerobic nicotinate degradation pathway regulator